MGNNDLSSEQAEDVDTAAAETERVIYRLERLPGTTFPPKNGLLHMVLKAMAQHWAWHVAYDGQFLATLPSHVKVLLLSYIAVYARDQPLRGLVRGLHPLFVVGDDGESEEVDSYQISDLDSIARLDFGGALGRWIGFKELSSELFLSQDPRSVAEQRKSKEAVPSSWEDEYDEDDVGGSKASSIPKSLDHGLRFEKLRFLSLAHPHPAAANWRSLLKLLSRLSILTHLSLAHWPVPTFTPNAINARIRHPTNRSLTFSYSGTDTYSGMENNWAEAAGILRKLSQTTYCLKWLDLEGCGDWVSALNWNGVDPDGEEYSPGSTGPEWNGSWRDIEFIRLGPGWLPHIDDSEMLGFYSQHDGRPPPRHGQQQQQVPPLRSLAASIHAPPEALSRARGIDNGTTSGEDNSDGSEGPADNSSWDVEVERIKYRRSKELERYRGTMHAARAAQRRVLHIRREARGKWVHFSFGIEELQEDVLRELLGSEYSSFFP